MTRYRLKKANDDKLKDLTIRKWGFYYSTRDLSIPELAARQERNKVKAEAKQEGAKLSTYETNATVVDMKVVFSKKTMAKLPKQIVNMTPKYARELILKDVYYGIEGDILFINFFSEIEEKNPVPGFEFKAKDAITEEDDDLVMQAVMDELDEALVNYDKRVELLIKYFKAKGFKEDSSLINPDAYNDVDILLARELKSGKTLCIEFMNAYDEAEQYLRDPKSAVLKYAYFSMDDLKFLDTLDVKVSKVHFKETGQQMDDWF